MKAEKRRTPPMGIKLQRALEQLGDAWKRLGLIPVDADGVIWEFDHTPALGLRDVDPETGAHIPHQHDPEYLIWRPQHLHARKTRGNGATTAGSDIGEMRKTRQLVRKRQAREAPPVEKPARPKAKIQSRGFSKTHRPFPRKAPKP